MNQQSHAQPATKRAAFKSFQESTREDWALIMDHLPDTQNMVADNALHLLRLLESDHGGFPVTRLEHSLQTATRAQRDGREIGRAHV